MNIIRKRLIVLFAISAALGLPGCANDYSAKAIEAWVVDADTKQPLEGVSVVAHWQLEYGLEGGGRYPFTVMETVTDKNGRFTFPAWGPKEVPSSLPSEARLKNIDPGVLLFKAGYDTFYEAKKQDRRPLSSFGGHGPSVREWYANGEKIELRLLKSVPLEARVYSHTDRQSDVEYAAGRLEGFDSNLRLLSPRGNCAWHNVIQALVASERARRTLFKADEAATRKGLYNRETLYQELVGNDSMLSPLCGSPKSLLKIEE